MMGWLGGVAAPFPWREAYGVKKRTAEALLSGLSLPLITLPPSI